ncbi:hypothetical protein P4637_08920 [Halalkalibacterium halodurans]|jgi:hypothetical protein|uniref:BH2886 protein n=2 Tax=Halalkalibacterium halodurans TaxID=86665 RepID=Q9K8W6_HALH5|nr:hypothetical protein [Halalkalibacterium halodurans]MDY7223439.1 hypothetical protein [Halalkalibacterium halodurans]MDY7242660.1 hypothetical protein [Halalkalibacterium halodurans]MED3645365.1 hypothetical protein [Halalkalibacterium halodurans]MED4081633.1 hypothetical protein [Halalkalibacterium halodurans]MED4084955.1 hypothetical protein [Halalkalibacterium halodurans]
MNKEDALRSFVKEVKKGKQQLKDKRFEEGIQTLTPYIELFRQTDVAEPQVFVSYAIAQLRTGEFEGFLRTVEDIKGMELKTEAEVKAVEKLEGFLHDVLAQLASSDKQL